MRTLRSARLVPIWLMCSASMVVSCRCSGAPGHPAEFELLDVGLEEGGVIGDGGQAVHVGIGLGHLEELGVVRQAAGEPVERDDDVVERLLLAPELLGLLGIVPDRRILERGVDGPQAFGFGIVVKDTSGDRPS